MFDQKIVTLVVEDLETVNRKVGKLLVLPPTESCIAEGETETKVMFFVYDNLEMYDLTHAIKKLANARSG